MRANIDTDEIMRALTNTPAPATSQRARCALRAARLADVASLCGLLSIAAGCWTISLEHRQKADKPILSPLVQPKDAITLEVIPVERAAADPLLGESLWRQLDEVGAVGSPETRARLRAAGLRVGSAGSNPPQTLRAAAAEQRTAAEKGGRRPRLTLLVGQETTLETAIINEEFSLRTVGVGGEFVRTYPNARCVLRVSGERVQDGWVRLTFKPELHHGPTRIQPMAGDGAWKLQEGQKVERLLDQWFDVELNIGELVVIGGAGAEPDSIGARFFHSGTPPAASERVLVLRVEDLQQIKPVRSNEW